MRIAMMGLVVALLTWTRGEARAADLVGPSASASASASVVRGPSECDVAFGLPSLGRQAQSLLHRACVEGPSSSPAMYQAVFRMISSAEWHAGFLRTILARHGRAELTAWAEGAAQEVPLAVQAQQRLDTALPEFAAGRACPQQRQSPALQELIDAVADDRAPSTVPFTSAFATCVGVPSELLTGSRLLTIRADGLRDVTVVMGTRQVVHARRFEPEQMLHLDEHRFVVVVVPESAPVVVYGVHDNQELPVVWRGIVARNTMIWGAPPRRSCLDLSVEMDPRTHLYIDGVRVDGRGSAEGVCEEPPPAQGATAAGVDRNFAVTLDQPSSGLPDHEVAAITCQGDRPVVRHLSPISATADASALRREGECEAVRLDLSTPDRQRVAVLGVAKAPGCELTPLWASDLQERIRHVLGNDTSHFEAHSYANFSAYAEASEALTSLDSKLRRDPPGEAARPDDTDANTLLGSAAQQAWRQGIDTLLSFSLQCTPDGEDSRGRPRYVYSLRVTSIGVSQLFARGYYGRDGLDLEDFIDVESVAFSTAAQQDAAIGSLLDRVFAVRTPRVITPPVATPYRRPQTLRVSGVFDSALDVPEEVQVRYKALEGLVRRPSPGDGGPPHSGDAPRPRICDGLVHRGARRSEAIAAAREAYAALPGKPRTVVLHRSRGELDLGSDLRAAIHEGELRPPRPGWYLVVVEDAQGEIEDAVCIDATARSVDVWGDVTISGGPLAFAINGSRSAVYLRSRFGATWYGPRRWLGGGYVLGYGMTRYAGSRGDWKDLEVANEQRLDWQRHALLLGPHVEVRSRATVLPVELRARFSPAVDAGLVNIERVDDELVEFRAGNGDDVVLDFDLDLNLDLSVGVPIGPVQLHGIVMFSAAAVDDSLRRSSTTVTQDANLYVGFGLGISGGRR